MKKELIILLLIPAFCNGTRGQPKDPSFCAKVMAFLFIPIDQPSTNQPAQELTPSEAMAELGIKFSKKYQQRPHSPRPQKVKNKRKPQPSY